ncbi:hypothetical protein ACWCPQ_25595 [Nocardia sp. NPDC001965]
MASEVERIGEECRRYSERMVERMAEAKARREARSAELAEQSAADMRRFWADMVAEQEGREHDPHTGVDEPGHQDTDRAARIERPPEPDSAGPRELEFPRPREEKHRQNTGSPPSGGGGTGVPGAGAGNTTRAGQSGELDPNEVIARSIAARRRNSVVAPIDDDGDDEADYYRRNSWLV